MLCNNFPLDFHGKYGLACTIIITIEILRALTIKLTQARARTRDRGPCLFHGTERHGTEQNAGLFHGTDKCDRGTINLILEYLTRNGLIRICKVRNDKLYY